MPRARRLSHMSTWPGLTRILLHNFYCGSNDLVPQLLHSSLLGIGAKRTIFKDNIQRLPEGIRLLQIDNVLLRDHSIGRGRHLMPRVARACPTRASAPLALAARCT